MARGGGGGGGASEVCPEGFSGFLTKVPQRPRLWSHDRRRFFVLTTHALEWFKPGQDTSKPPHGRLLLEGLQIEPVPGARIVLQPPGGQPSLVLYGDNLEGWHEAISNTLQVAPARDSASGPEAAAAVAAAAAAVGVGAAEAAAAGTAAAAAPAPAAAAAPAPAAAAAPAPSSSSLADAGPDAGAEAGAEARAAGGPARGDSEATSSSDRTPEQRNNTREALGTAGALVVAIAVSVLPVPLTK